MSDMTQQDALRLAAELTAGALKEATARCAVLAEYIDQCEHAGARTGAWRDAVRDLRAEQDRRRALIRRRDLIQQALDCAVGEQSGARLLAPPPPARATGRPQRQVQVQVRRRSRAG